MNIKSISESKNVVKDIESAFFHLNTEFVDFKSKIDNLTSKYEDIEKKLEERKKSCFKCNNCKKTFECLKDFQEHKKDVLGCQGSFKCEECEKTFKSEKQLSAPKDT